VQTWMIFRFVVLISFAVACGALVFSSEARAQSCSFSVSDVAFGSVDVTTNAAADTSTTVSVTCTALAPAALRVCVNLGPGGGGAANAAARHMSWGAAKLTYGLFSDAGRTVPAGSDFWTAGGGPLIIDFPQFKGTVTRTASLYGRIYAGQHTVPVGSYASGFSTAETKIQYGPLSLADCNLLPARASATFHVRASVPANCSVTASNLGFGAIGALNGVVDASSTVSPACTNGAAYNIGLDGGLSFAADPTRRKMTKASQFIIYGLYRDAARSQPFGNRIGCNTVSGVGSGVAQSVRVYGRIHPQRTPSSGLYSDTVVVTLTF
jgi:spore coat protein U-like protein